MKILKRLFKRPMSEKRTIEWLIMYKSRISITQAKLEYAKSLIARNIIDEKYLKVDINTFKVALNLFREEVEPHRHKLQKDSPDELSRLESLFPIELRTGRR